MFSMKISIIEAKHTLDNFESWAKPRSVDTSMLVGPGSSFV